MRETKRLDYFDGLRIIFCIIVIISHFMDCFYPLTKKLFYNDGSYAVLYFFVLSGFLVNYSICKNHLIKRPSFYTSVQFVVKRYLRLLPVVFVSILVSGILFFSGIIRTVYYADLLGLSQQSRLVDNYLPTEIKSILQIPYEALVGSFVSRPYLNPPFWTIRYELFGVFIIWLLSSLLKQSKYRFYIIGMIFVGGVLLLKEYNFSALVLGILIADAYYNDNAKDYFSEMIIKMIKEIHAGVALTLFIISYACYTITMIQQLNFISIFFLFISVQKSTIIKRILSMKCLTRMGSYSFEIYAVHWIVICSFSCCAFKGIGFNYTTSMIVLLVTIIISIVLGKLLHIVCIPINLSNLPNNL